MRFELSEEAGTYRNGELNCLGLIWVKNLKILEYKCKARLPYYETQRKLVHLARESKDTN